MPRAKSAALARRHLLVHHMIRRRHRLAVVILLSIVSSFGTMLQPLPFKFLIDNAIAGRPVTGRPARWLEAVGLGDASGRTLVVVAVIAGFVIAVSFMALAALLEQQWENVGQQMTGDVMSDMHAKVQRLSVAYHHRFDTGDTMSRIQWDSQGIYTMASAVLITPAVSIVTILAVGWSAWNQSSRVALVIMAFAPILAGASVYFGDRLRDAAKLQRESQTSTVSFVTQVMHSMPVVQAFTAEQRNLDTFRGLSSAAIESSRKQALTTALAQSISQFVGATGVAVVLVIGGREVALGRMSIGALVVFLQYSQTLQGQAEALLGAYRAARSTEVALDRVLDVLQSEGEIPEPSRPRSLTAPNRRGPSSVTFDGVRVGYEPGRPVILSVDLEIAAGESVALVGPTGAGKSTLLSMIPRVIDPWSGRVLVDGTDVRDVSLRDLREQVAVVRQEPILVHGTVADNIALGRPDAERSAIERAAEAAMATDFIHELPEGFDTLIGGDERSLSGGQRQRLAIARALLKESPILILDEPTSALDAAAEQAMVETIHRLRGRCTIFVIAHRLSTVRAVDRIVVLDQGWVVETGSHDQLSAAGGWYASINSRLLAGMTP